jgi:hypothetical protein
MKKLLLGRIKKEVTNIPPSIDEHSDEIDL